MVDLIFVALMGRKDPSTLSMQHPATLIPLGAVKASHFALTNPYNSIIVITSVS
jgi:hypothetical protein